MLVDRGYRQIPAAAAARFVASPGDELSPIFSQLDEAEGPAEKARYLLRLSDDLVLRYLGALQRACFDAGFAIGANYLDCRVAALQAVRDREGRLPEHIVQTLEIWRAGLVAVAGGMAA
jgi:hypothetical protein